MLFTLIVIVYSSPIHLHFSYHYQAGAIVQR